MVDYLKIHFFWEAGKMGKRFGIDIDGTVTSPDSIIKFVNDDFNMNLTLEEITEYDLTPFVNINEKEFFTWFIKREPDIYRESPIASGASKVLKEWKKENHLFFISARARKMMEITQEWLEKHRIPFDHIELVGSHDKIAAARNLKVDIFLEDKHDNAVEIHEACGIPVLLFDAPYNRKPIPEGVFRVHSWEEAYHWVNQWMKQTTKI